MREGGEAVAKNIMLFGVQTQRNREETQGSTLEHLRAHCQDKSSSASLPDVQTGHKGLFVHNENLQTKL